MIKEWRFSNFKSVKEPQNISIYPLSIITGANSSGKSTLLQSILLLTQSLNSKVRQRQIILNAEQVRLGTFDDVLSENSLSREIHIGFTLDLDLRNRTDSKLRISDFPYITSLNENDQLKNGELVVNLCIGSGYIGEEQRQSKHYALQAEVLSGEYRIQSKAAINKELFPQASNPSTQEIKITKRAIEEINALYGQFEVPKTLRGSSVDSSILAYSVTGLEKRLRYPTYRRARLSEKVDIIGIQLDHFLPGRIINSYRSLPRRISSLLDELGDLRSFRNTISKWESSEDPVQAKTANKLLELQKKYGLDDQKFAIQITTALFAIRPRKEQIIDLDNIIKEIVASFSKSDSERKSIEALSPPNIIGYINQSISSVFSSIRYLGPLRDEPRPIYDISGYSDPSDVGTRGENTASVLDLFANKLVDFIEPNNRDAEPIKTKLKEAVRRWLTYFDMAINYETEEEGKLGHRLYIIPDNIRRRLDLTNVGVGVSQLLPIIVTSLLAEPGSILIFEQPELHLHPKIQSLLGDFFISLLRTGKQCIVETHSEYLINRLRLRVAESNWDSNLKDNIGIYFVERAKGNTTFKNIRINDYGSIPNWPSGFFDQGPEESEKIMMAARNKKLNKKT
jgi:predicted ATPase